MERTRRRFFTFAVSAGAVLVILAAAASGVFRLAVQSVPGYRADVERYVRELTGKQVRIDDLGLTWRYYYPSLDLNGIALLAPDGKTAVLQAERLRLGFGLLRLVRGDTTPTRLELEGLGVNANVDRDGAVTVQGIESAGTEPGEALEGLRPLTRFSRVQLERCRVNLRDERRGAEVYSFGIERASLDRGLLGDVLSVDLALPASLGDSAHFETSFSGELLEPGTWSGSVSGEVTNLVLQTWLAPLLVPGVRVFAPDTELRWRGRIERGAPQWLSVDLRSGPIRAARAQHAAVIEGLQLRGSAERVPEGWRARLDSLDFTGEEGRWPASSAELRVTPLEGAAPAFELDVGYLRLGDLAPWLQMVSAPPGVAAISEATGDVRELQLRRQGAGDAPRYSYRARFENLALPATEHPVGFAGLRGEVAGDELGGRAVLQESPLTLEVPGKFATPSIPLEAFEAEMEWRQRESTWRVAMPQFRWRLWGMRGRGHVSLTLPDDGSSPVLDLAAQFSADDVMRAKTLMPQFWGAGLRSWLDRAIVAGRAPRADLVIQGPLADFPFQARQTGRWSLDIDAADIELAYHPDWPPVSDLSAHLRFEGNSLAIQSTKGSVAGSPIESASARFPDFSTGQLLIDGSVRGETARFYDFLSRSPVREKLKGLLMHTTGSGPSAVEIHLDIPVKDAAHTQVHGKVALDGVELRHASLPEPIRDIRGEIAFAGSGRITAQGLSARLYEVPLEASIAPQADGSSLLSAGFKLAIDPAGAGASSLIPAWLRKQAAGSSAWRATLALGSGFDSPVRLATDLAGVELKYPAPLGKAKDVARPLALTIGSAADAPLHITVDGDQLGADLKFAQRRGVMTLERGALRLGAGAPPKAGEAGLVLSGDLPEIDVKEWTRALTESGLGAPGQAIRRADFHFGLARWSPCALRDVRYQWTAARKGWTLAMSGPGATGEVRWSAADRGQLIARLDSLALGYAPAEAGLMPSAVIDPTRLPLFDLDMRRLVVGQADLGHVVFATARTERGQKARVLKAEGGIVTLSGEGEWRRRAGQSSAAMSGDLATTSIATLLRTFGYTPNLDAKAARFKTALTWAPSDTGLDWPQAQGTVHLEFDSGQLRAVEPGAGRVLGLVNFYALPRRLALNFRDVVSSGLGFDRITGDFELRDGSATTQNLQVAGPSVRMDVRGRIGLAARDYDQDVTVYPDVSGGVTLGAVLLGGPIAGVLTLIAQQVMNKPLNQVTQLSYRVTGSWDNPQVTRSAQPPTPTPTPAPTPAPAPPPTPAGKR